MRSTNIADYSILKVFDCPCYGRVIDDKLDESARKCIFLSYVQESEAISCHDQN